MLRKPPTKSDQIYQELRRAIVRLEIAPGEALSEKTFAERFGVSRTPVREALQRLSDEDLVTIIPQSGTHASHISVAAAQEGFVIRCALEIESVRHACNHVTDDDLAGLRALLTRMEEILRCGHLPGYIEADDAFHAAIADISGFPRLWKFINQAKAHLDRMRQLSAPVPGHLTEVTAQHRAILTALEKRNAVQAELAMRVHLDSSFSVMMAMRQDCAPLFEPARTTRKPTDRETAT